jgi:hypothetical protein
LPYLMTSRTVCGVGGADGPTTMIVLLKVVRLNINIIPTSYSGLANIHNLKRKGFNYRGVKYM